MTKTIPDKKKCKKAKWLSEEALQTAEKRKAKGKGERERYIHLNAEFQNSEVRKAWQRNRGKQKNERLEISSRKLEIPREHFTERWA